MMDMADAIRPIDQARAARVLLGVLDDDIDMVNRALREANDEQAVHLMIASLARTATELTICIMGEDNARAVAQRSVLDAQLAEGGSRE
ncbi:hypothetical protein FOH10_30410 [Nocardia otitidiscaviarum]|uniref:Uncharacterized protein n=1 Tax=Nocardia otitidiscaviarum TaxID=1823 RepID=A0A516NU24_9NOCA|nr:hypothetical protein [Nocardia otitidiscaviarum]MCP9621767.1 hypothetical protein [Nocardia otitidiscaviarum]QDP82403.1 hypothetical protein FOH10_30410 [Nocardia otitidiscaviarum]